MKTTNSGSTGFLGNVLLKKILLTCGMLASLLYIGMNIYVPMHPLDVAKYNEGVC
jgi:hypothetical protein